MNYYSLIFFLSASALVILIDAEDQEHPIVQDAEHKMFLDFMEKYDKKYNNPHEYMYRLKVFKDNMKRAQEMQKSQLGTATYGATKFADLTKEEFRAKHLGLKINQSNLKHIPPQATIPEIKIPTNFDWRDHNAVTDVKDQGNCGSCWTFSTTGCVEGQYAIKYGQIKSFSEQEIVDCDKTNSGCEGGWPVLAFQDLDHIGGLALESDYPYTGEDGTCTFDKSMSQVKLIGSVSIPVNETAMAQYLYANGPISICLNADDMQLYTGGISHPSSCDKYYLDHAVLITGYGVAKVNKKKMPYWIIKNSWGTSWGEEGYYRVYRGDGTCGLDLMAASAIIE